MAGVEDIIIRVLAILGPGGVLLFWVRDRRRIKNLAAKEEQQAPFEVRATAASTLDAEITALRKSFDTDRAVKDRTIQDLRDLVEEKDNVIREKNQRIEELQEVVESLQEQVEELQARAALLSSELASVLEQLGQVRTMPDN